MRNVLETASDTVLLVALLALFAIPVFVFNSISPTTSRPTVTASPPKETLVLGETTVAEVTYTTELLSNLAETYTEELHRLPHEYSVKFILAPGEYEQEKLIRVVNTSDWEGFVSFSVEQISNGLEKDSVLLSIDETSIPLSQMDKSAVTPSVKLEAGDWVTIGVDTRNAIEDTATFVVNAEFSE